MRTRHRKGEAGASLVEVMMALLVTTVGTLAVASLMAYGTRLQATARDTTTAAGYGRQQLERLRMLPPLSPSRALGPNGAPAGSLTADVANYSTGLTTQQARFRCRWVVSAGPAGTKQINLVVLSNPGNLRLAEIGGSVWP